MLATGLGGTDEQVKDQVRFRWTPNLAGGNLKVNMREQTVHDELRQVLGSLKPDPTLLFSTFDYRIDVTRRLTRELARKGQGELALNTIPMTLFDNAEQDEARARRSPSSCIDSTAARNWRGEPPMSCKVRARSGLIPRRCWSSC